VFTDRPVTAEDVPLLVTLAAASEAVDRLNVLFTQRELDHYCADPDLDLPRDLRLWLTADGTPAASAMLPIAMRNDRVRGRIVLRILPELRDSGLEAVMLDWAVSRLRSFAAPPEVPRELTVVVNQDDRQRRDRLAAASFQSVREFRQLDLPLVTALSAVELPDGYQLRTTGHAADLELWHDLFNESFVDHWNFQPMTLAELQHEWALPDYDPTLDFVIAAPDGTLDAFCSAEYDADHGGIGWLSILGTRRGRRGRGFGRALLVAAVNALRERGAHTARLLVDRESPTNAGALYEWLGFRETAVTHRMRLTLPAA
jgi:mycothiol synthase